MTEAEAKTKWCPMVRHPYFNYSGAQQTAVTNDRMNGNSNCIASECMMWRWKDRPQDMGKTGHCGLAATNLVGIAP